MANKLVEGPATDNYGEHPPANHKGGPGCYDGVDGLPKRTHSPEAVPEKIYDEQAPLKKGKG